MMGAPHFEIPFQIGGRTARYVEEDSADELRQNVAVLLDTRLGERLVAADFGLSDPAFELASGVPDLDEIEVAVDRFEPRAQVNVVARDESDGVIHTVISVRAREVA